MKLMILLFVFAPHIQNPMFLVNYGYHPDTGSEKSKEYLRYCGYIDADSKKSKSNSKYQPRVCQGSEFCKKISETKNQCVPFDEKYAQNLRPCYNLAGCQCMD